MPFTLPPDPAQLAIWIRKAELFDALRRMMGYTQNATEQTVSIFEDDATRDFCLHVGARCYYGKSLEAAIEEAIKAGEDKIE